ncbi:MAG: hypothetical protein H0U46_06005 [Actinobacteria bacterium]|nr:hypothetical protein [Actinomycetota bacterium]
MRDPDLVAQIEDLQTVVQALGERPTRDPDLVGQIADLQAVVEVLGQQILPGTLARAGRKAARFPTKRLSEPPRGRSVTPSRDAIG